MIVSEQPGTTRDAIDTVLAPRRPDVRPRRHGRDQAQAPSAPGHRVLLGAEGAAGRRARRRGARPRRCERGRRRAGSVDRGHRAQVDVLDARRALEVGHRRDRDRRHPRAARAPPAAAAAGSRRVGQDRPRRRQAPRPHRAAVQQVHVPRPHGRAESLPAGAAGGPPAAVAKREAAQPPLRHPDDRAPTSLPLLRQRPGPDHAGLRLLGRESAPREVRPGGSPRGDRLRQRRNAAVREAQAGASRRFPGTDEDVVVGAGAWGTAFARVLAERGHDVTLAARDPEQARAIAETGRNPRYLSDVSLDGIGAASLDGGAVRRGRAHRRSPCRAAPSPRSWPRCRRTGRS